jgi:hypothetical protein
MHIFKQDQDILVYICKYVYTVHTEYISICKRAYVLLVINRTDGSSMSE